MITLGDKIWYWPDAGCYEPLIGLVVKVWDYNDVNIIYWNIAGIQHSAQHVKVVYGATHIHEYGYCEVPRIEAKKVGRPKKVAT